LSTRSAWGIQLEQIQTVLFVVRCKVSEEVQSIIADFGRGMVESGNAPHPRLTDVSRARKSAVLSLLLSLHKQRKYELK
jgi:hypothetical protein